jgi:hypothetical protein
MNKSKITFLRMGLSAWIAALPFRPEPAKDYGPGFPGRPGPVRDHGAGDTAGAAAGVALTVTVTAQVTAGIIIGCLGTRPSLAGPGPPARAGPR